MDALLNSEWLKTTLAGIGGFISAFVLARVASGPALQTAITNQLTILLSAEEKRFKDLESGMQALAAKYKKVLEHLRVLEDLCRKSGIAVPERPDIDL